MTHRGSSRERYREFVQKYKRRELDEPTEGGDASSAESKRPARGKRREYLRDYLRWLWPHRYAIGAVFLLALVSAGLEMVEPLFMRFIVDRVLLNGALDTPARIARLNVTGALFVAVILIAC